MSCLMYGLKKATQPPCKMRERMRQRCVLCVVKNAPPSQFVESVRSIVVRNVLTSTLDLPPNAKLREMQQNTHGTGATHQGRHTR